MNRVKERLNELKDKGLITPEQYESLLAALEEAEFEPPQTPDQPQIPTPSDVPQRPSVPDAAGKAAHDIAPEIPLQTAGRALTVRLVFEDLRVRGVAGLPGVRIVSGQSSVRTHQSGDAVMVESTATEGEFHGFSFRYGLGNGEDVTIEVPENMPCELKTVSGDISLDNLKGTVNVHSVSGDIDGRSLAHVGSVASTSGDLDLEKCFIDGDAVTKSGDVDVDNCTVHGMLKSYSGDVSTLNTILSDADVLSFSGDVQLERVTIQGAAHVKTTSGDVRAELDQHDVMVDIDTRSGEATVRGAGIDVQTTRQRIPVGLATVEFSAHTGSGDIDVRLT